MRSVVPARLLAAEPVVAAASLLVGLCTVIVLLAVLRSFLDARAAGPIVHRRRSFVATGTMLSFFAAVYLLIRFNVGVVPVSVVVRRILAVAGVIPVVLGCWVNLAGRARLGRNWANQVTVYRDQTLVTDGVFGYVRHPLYASLIWMGCGAALVYCNAAALAATLFVFVPAMSHRAALEERALAERFPDYCAYRRHVWRFFPKHVRGVPR